MAVLSIVAHVEKRWGTRKGAEEDKKMGKFYEVCKLRGFHVNRNWKETGG